MLRLDRMQISGFKSFSDKTEVRLPGGITCVVGPNGCGKSNIGDAINWVLGEQSPKMLRGKQMADVIFAGSEKRKPVGMAEVTLELRGAEGLPHADQGRVAVTRRLFRSGESDYLINGKRARLRDIQDVLERARVGARTYATIEQGKIDQILNAKPKDRRMIIEDAAGVAGYKHKRRLTEMKLEATHANLLRVHDIVVEVERQIRSLKRQAAKARRYRKLRDELRAKERIRFGRRAREMDAELEKFTEAEAVTRDAEAGAAARLAGLESRLEEERQALEQANATFRTASEELHRLELNIDREEGQIRSCKEKIAEFEASAARLAEESQRLVDRRDGIHEEVERHRERVEQGRTETDGLRERLTERQAVLEAAEQQHREQRQAIEGLRRDQFDSMNRLAELRNRLRSTEDAIARNASHKLRIENERSASGDDLSRLRTEADGAVEEAARQRAIVEESRGALVACGEALLAARDRLASLVDELAGHRESEKSAAARLTTLEDVATRFAGVSDGVRTLLGSAGAEVQTRGVVADYIEAGADVELAAEEYLKSFLPTVIVENDADVEKAASLLRSAGAGRTSLISRGHPAGRPAVGQSNNGSGGVPEELTRDVRVHGRLLEQITLHTSANGVLSDRVGDAVLVDNLKSALDLHRSFPDVDFLTPDGDVVYASGVVSAGGHEQGDHGLLAHSRQTQEAQRQLKEAAVQVAGLEKQVESAREEVAELETRSATHREAAEEAERKLVTLDLAAQRFVEDSERTGRRADVLDDELAAAVEEAASLEGTRAELQATLTDADAFHQELESSLGERGVGVEQSESALRALGEEVTMLRTGLAAADQRQHGLEQEAKRLAGENEELSGRVDSLRGESDNATRRASETIDLQKRTEVELVANLERREKDRSESARMEREIGESQRKLSEDESCLRQLRDERSRLGEQSHQVELERSRLEADRTHLDELSLQELGLAAAEAATMAEESGDVLDEVDLPALEEEVEKLRAALERIGPVNMTAIEEFTELEERHGFLSTHQDDLEQAMASLRETIRRINRTSRERFLTAFEAVRKSYQEIFQVLFNGGRADLRLEDEEDVLECGIEIMVQPPGKRLGSIQLMSGGEKALSAIALLFAVFRYQPSPFCLLDEVDAALDDANVTRFARMIREYSEQTQFIMITHNKLSMESADLLYGVTMEEPGVSKLVSLQLQ